MGFLGSIMDSFTGKSARRDIDRGIDAVGQGRNSAIGAYREYGDRAQGYMKPYREQGAKAFGLYGDTLGVNGTGARDSAQGLYLSDDILQKQLALQQKQRGWSSNSRGEYGSGADALAASRVNLQNYGNWQNQLAGMGQQGQQAAATSAGIDQQTGAGIAGAYQNESGQLAGLYGQRAQTQNALAQNIIGLGSVAASFWNPGGVNRLGSNTTQGSAAGGAANGSWTATTQPANWWQRNFT